MLEVYHVRQFFSLTNGACQRNSLPVSFFVSTWMISVKKFNNVNAGCIIGAALINHLMYADDLVLLALSSMLLSVYSNYGLEHQIKYNSTKSNVIIFCCKNVKDIHMQNFVLNDEILMSL